MSKRRRRFVAIDRTTDPSGFDSIDAICEQGRAWSCYWQINNHAYSEWTELPALPEIEE